jgi:hypothetical protein
VLGCYLRDAPASPPGSAAGGPRRPLFSRQDVSVRARAQVLVGEVDLVAHRRRRPGRTTATCMADSNRRQSNQEPRPTPRVLSDRLRTGADGASDWKSGSPTGLERVGSWLQIGDWRPSPLRRVRRSSCCGASTTRVADLLPRRQRVIFDGRSAASVSGWSRL